MRLLILGLLLFASGAWAGGVHVIDTDSDLSLSDVGYGFSVAADATFPNTNEVNVLLITNPSTSTESMRIVLSSVSTDSTQGIVTTRFYTNPTVTANGTDVSGHIVNRFVGLNNAPTSVVKIYTGPSTSAKGTYMLPMVSAALTSPSLVNVRQTIILAPNNSILITAQASNLGLLASLSVHFYLAWVEK